MKLQSPYPTTTNNKHETAATPSILDLGLLHGDRQRRLPAVLEMPLSVDDEANMTVGDLGGISLEECTFRFLPKLNYRAERELRRIEKLQVTKKTAAGAGDDESDDDNDVVEDGEKEKGKKKQSKKDKKKAQEKSQAALSSDALMDRVRLEREMNVEELRKVETLGLTTPIKYGDIVQLQHLGTGMFVSMKKKPALLNSNNRKVVLNNGSLASHFRVLPRFKVRSEGTPVYAGDEIFLESVKHRAMLLCASPSFKHPRCALLQGEAPPRLLRHPEKIELNGKFLDESQRPAIAAAADASAVAAVAAARGAGEDQSSDGGGGEAGASSNSPPALSFTVHLYARFSAKQTLQNLNTLHHFRLFSPEFNGYLQASTNRDKGDDETFESGGSPHKLKYTASAAANSEGGGAAGCTKKSHTVLLTELSPKDRENRNNPVNLSAKAIWRLETEGITTGAVVHYKSTLRIRHVATNKLLAVLPPKGAAPGTPATPGAAAVAAAGTAASDAGAYAAFRTVLVDAPVSGSAEERALGPALAFQLLPTEAVTHTDSETVRSVALKNSPSSLRIQHKASKHFVASLPQRLGFGEQQSSDAGTEGGGVLALAAEPTGEAVFKLIPIEEGERKVTDEVASFLAPFKLFARGCYRRRDGAVDGHAESGRPSIEECEEVIEICAQLIDDLIRGDAPEDQVRDDHAGDNIARATAMDAATFSTVFGGEPDAKVQGLCCELKLMDAVFECCLAPYNAYMKFNGADDNGPFGRSGVLPPVRSTQKKLATRPL